MNLRETILTADDIPSEMMHVKEWNVDVLIKGMSAGERVKLTQNAYDQNTQQVNMAAVYPDIVVACVYNPETDEPVFTDNDKSAILGKSSAAIESIAAVGLRLSGIGEAAQDAAGKDSSNTPSEGSA